MANWKLSPSDFAFLWEECKKCFYLKVKGISYRPRTPMPKIFTKIDLLLKEFFDGKRTREIHSDLPPGVVLFGERWLESRPINFFGISDTCYIRGKTDTIVKFDDGSYGVIDFKTSERKDEHIQIYSRQLHAYAYALGNSAPGSLSLSPISKIGVLCVEPTSMKVDKGIYSYEGEAVFKEFPRDDKKFLDFLKEVTSLLQQPTPPPPGNECEFCKYKEIEY